MTSAESPTPAAKSGYIPSLDGIRAVSFLLVFVSHAITEAVPGGFGVTVFFFLSGYLITTLMRVEHDKTGTISLSRFYARRALRIFPNFYVVLIAATLLAMAGVIGTVGEDGIAGRAFAAQALYANNYYAIFAGDYGVAKGTSVFWSLAVEEHFYFLFPAVFLVLQRWLTSGFTRSAAIFAMCAVVLVWRCVVSFALDLPAADYTYKASDTRFDSMLFGCALAVCGNPMMDRSKCSDAFWLLVATPAALTAIGLTFVIREPHFRETIRYTIQGLALIPLFIAAIRCHRHPLFAWLNWKPVRFVGTLSYTLYLVHLTAIIAFQDRLGSDGLGKWIAALVSLAVSLVIAVAMHYTIERPLAGWRKRLHAENRRPSMRDGIPSADVKLESDKVN